jgi:glycosidase
MASVCDPHPDGFVPEWARRAVWYQIFPERFRNGDPSNDPTAESLKGSHHGDHAEGWQVHRWTSDWYELQSYERSVSDDLWYHLSRRRYGGDLQGILDRLDYLQELGINALYLNPVFEAPSAHKYDGASYHHVDPHFGPDPPGDRRLMAAETPDDPATWVWTRADRMLLSLVREVHARGMHLILDGVFNHMGVNSFAFRDVVEKQRASRFAGWFKIRSWASPATGEGFHYESWRDHSTLPELRQDRGGIVAGPRDYIFAATRRWIAPDGIVENGIDGWRLDVARWVAHPFWKDWRRLVKSINPNAFLVAEIIDTVEFSKAYLQGDEFDAVMNYNFAFACDEFFVRERRRIRASAFDRLLRELRQAHPACVAGVMQDLLDSHDTARLATHVVNRDSLDYRAFDEVYHPVQSRGDNPQCDTRKPTAEERRMQMLLVIFQMTYVGAPMIYYGDEAGMWGANDPCCRKPMIWPELRFDDEAWLPNGRRRSVADVVAFDRELFRHYQRMIGLRRRLEALQVGDYETLVADDERGLLAFTRRCPEQQVAVVLNPSPSTQRISIRGLPRCQWRDLLGEGRVYAGRDGAIEIDIAPCWGAVLLREPV